VFFSLRGGTGKSTLAAEVAAGLAANVWDVRGANPALRVALIDLDFRASTMCITTGLQGPTLGDLAAASQLDSTMIESALLRHDSGARVMLAGRNAGGEFGSTSTVARVLSYLDEQGFDHVVLDVAAGVGDLNSYALQAADEVYYVFDATAPGVYDLYRGVETLRRMGHREKIRYVANRDDGVDLDEVLGDLRGRLSASVPTSRALAEASESHRLAVLDGDRTAELLRPLAMAVTGEPGSHHMTARAFAGWPQAAGSRR
jgi:MinD superfamily P-loop ATPase